MRLSQSHDSRKWGFKTNIIYHKTHNKIPRVGITSATDPGVKLLSLDSLNLLKHPPGLLATLATNRVPQRLSCNVPFSSSFSFLLGPVFKVKISSFRLFHPRARLLELPFSLHDQRDVASLSCLLKWLLALGPPSKLFIWLRWTDSAVSLWQFPVLQQLISQVARAEAVVVL